jgi:PIN domain nuclease of toxin-antitoxin system
VRFLLDTNAVLWVQTNAPRIEAVRDLLLDDENDIFISTVSWWEIAIKVRIGKLNADVRAMRLNAQEKSFLELPLHSALPIAREYI